MTSKLAAVASRLPIAILGLAIALSSLQASCSDAVDATSLDDSEGDAAAAPDRGTGDGAPRADAPSMDSDADRADGMSYGDGYSP
jgi:hypothetical protein